MNFTIYDLATGRILYSYFVGEDADYEAPKGCGYLVGDYSPKAFRVVDGEAVPLETVDPLAPRKSALAERRETLEQDSVLQLLVSATPQQIDAWVNSNVNSIGDVKALLSRVLKLVAVIARN